MSIASPRTPEEIRMAEISDSSYRAGWDDAIEECARVVEKRAGLYTTQLCAQLAAAIRALKDTGDGSS